jgi:hypothetical protein
VKARVQSQASACGICARHSGTGTGSSLSISVFHYQHDPIIVCLSVTDAVRPGHLTALSNKDALDCYKQKVPTNANENYATAKNS